MKCKYLQITMVTTSKNEEKNTIKVKGNMRDLQNIED